MPLPEQFNEFEHLQDTYRRYFNRQIRDFFSDLGGDDWEPDISSTRGSLRHACTHKDNDTAGMTQMRFQLFNYVRRLKFDIPIIGVPVPELNSGRKYKPQVVMHFQEDYADIEQGYSPVTGRVSFRLMEHTPSTINPTVAQTFANRINSNFGLGGGFVWRKGREMYSYTDWSKGYQLQILARSKSDAINLADRVLDCQNDSLDMTKFKTNTTEDEAAAYPIVPENKMIYGQMRQEPRQRPIADVRFQYAVLHVQGLANAIPLVDRTGLYPSALVS